MTCFRANRDCDDRTDPPGPLYKVVTVDDEAPTSLADFVGPGELILDYQEGLHSVRGEGVQSQESIRFHQRDEDDAEADARIWHIRGKAPVLSPNPTTTTHRPEPVALD